MTTAYNESYSSVFLTKMNLKREEQQKSIDAYRSQHVYTALLSQVAIEFYKRIVLNSLTKDGIEYHHVFSGKDAVDRLLSVLRIHDRLEALQVGCALRHQGFFHDVNYEPFFIDSQHELYEFRDLTVKDDQVFTGNYATTTKNTIVTKLFLLDLQSSELPNGIYTDLTDCYSPTCTSDNLCYSWSCLRKKVKKI